MRVRVRLAAVLVALLLPALVLARWTLAAGKPVDLARTPPLPDRVGPWTATQERALEADVLAMIDPDAYRVRLYEAEGRTPIWLYVGVYAGRAGSGKGAHEPEVCYPAQGWEVLRSRPAALRLRDGDTLHAQELAFHRGQARQAVLYWFQPAARWPTASAAEELLRVLDAVAGRPQYAFVRLSAPSDESPDAGRDLAEFAVGIAPAVRELTERLSVRDGAGG
jgi:EpsI family protein